MRNNYPTQSQLRFLALLGYMGQKPTSSLQASAAITALQNNRSPEEAEKALQEQQQEDARHNLAYAKQQIREMLRDNKKYQHDLYRGFRFLLSDEITPSDVDVHYLETFLPLSVAAKYPELLARETIDYVEVDSNDTIEFGTPIISGPGRLVIPKRKAGCRRVVWTLIVVAVAIILFGAYLTK